MPVPGTYSEEEISVADRTETEPPRLYKVLLHNDDYTSMDFVVHILSRIFNKSIEEATRIMLSVHHNGTGIAGVYTKEICECKIVKVHELARELEFPLLCTMEPA